MQSVSLYFQRRQREVINDVLSYMVKQQPLQGQEELLLVCDTKLVDGLPEKQISVYPDRIPLLIQATTNLISFNDSTLHVELFFGGVQCKLGIPSSAVMVLQENLSSTVAHVSVLAGGDLRQDVIDFPDLLSD